MPGQRRHRRDRKRMSLAFGQRSHPCAALATERNLQMTNITVTLPEEQISKLQELAQAAGTSPEELLRASVEEWLSHPGQDFAAAAAYVLRKNAELYRRPTPGSSHRART